MPNGPEIIHQDCDWLLPVNLGTEEIPDWEFSVSCCSTTNLIYEKIESNGQELYIAKLWDYGELFIAFFLFVIILFLISKTIFSFLFEKLVRIKRKNE